MQMNICLRDLPTRKKSTLPSRVPTHAYADCKISGQQPTQLYKEFPRVHEVGHWEKNDAQLGDNMLPTTIYKNLKNPLIRSLVPSSGGYVDVLFLTPPHVRCDWRILPLDVLGGFVGEIFHTHY